ncbi:MAG: endonuclease MutS2 [Pseudanabaenaceae cyanobacterium bins.68]|nr:endonuclease MutS2 [Pseudanabaenaceae cyanobacterium bins.68]
MLNSLALDAATLELLEWQRLCRQVSGFAATKLGMRAKLEIGASLDQSLGLLNLTKEVYGLDEQIGGGLSLEGVEDITLAIARSSKGGMLDPKELWQVATTLAGARHLRRQIDNSQNCSALQEMVQELRTYPELEQQIYQAIDEGGMVLDRASEKLANYRSTMRQVREQVLSSLQNLIQRKGNALQENIITQRGDRYVLAVKATHKDQIPGIVHDASASGLTIFVEPNGIVNGNNRLRQLERYEQTEIERILQALSDQVGEVSADLARLLQVLTEIDLAIARARYGYWLKAKPPQLFQDLNTPTQLRQLRHPLLVWQEQREEGRAVVPITVKIEPITRVVVITGPNTGGKTATLKTIGLVALMAKAGMFVPAAEPVALPWFDLILADIGDEQSLEQNLSTFSGHIRRIGGILSIATPNSLILLDEVGAGTDPTEGTAIAIALLEYLAKQVKLTIATTHFGELKMLKYKHEQFENASVEFDDLALAPTYRLLWGIPGRSNALAIARRLGLSEEILQPAQTHLGFGSIETNRLISELENQTRQQTVATEKVIELLRDTERLHQEIVEKSANLRSQYQELRQHQEQQILGAIAQAKKEIARVIRKLQAGDGSASSAQWAEQRMGQIAKLHLPSAQKTEQKSEPPYQPQVGDRVRIIKLDKIGLVLSTSSSNGEIGLRLGQMKMSVHQSEVEKV